MAVAPDGVGYTPDGNKAYKGDHDKTVSQDLQEVVLETPNV
jgi:hypothetical protein